MRYAWLAVVLMIAASQASARQVQMSGKKLSMRPGKLTLQARGYDDVPAPGSAADPSVVGATLAVKGPRENVQVDLPAAGWRGASTGWTYSGALVPGSPVRKVLLRRGLLKVLASSALPMRARVGKVDVALTMGDAEYCVDYGDANAQDVVRDSGGRFDARKSPTASWCTGCGDGVLASMEECDDGNHDSGDGCSSNCAAENLPSVNECVPVNANEVKDAASDDPGWRTLFARATTFGFNATRLLMPMKCQNGVNVPGFYIGAFASNTPGAEPMLLMVRRGLFQTGERAFAIYRVAEGDSYVVFGARRFHIVQTSATTGTVDEIDDAGHVLRSGTIPPAPGGAIAAAIQTAAEASAKCQARADAEDACWWQNFWQAASILGATATAGVCIYKITVAVSKGDFSSAHSAWKECFAAAGATMNAAKGTTCNSDDIDKDGQPDWPSSYACYVDEGEGGQCFKGRCVAVDANTSGHHFECWPAGWEKNLPPVGPFDSFAELPADVFAGLKLSCDAQCLEECHEGTCEGFKVNVAGDGSAGYVGLASASYTSTPCTSGGGWEGNEYGGSDQSTYIWWCGSPVFPVTVTVGGNTSTFTQADYITRWYQYPDGNGYWQMHTCCSGMQFCCSIDPIVPMPFSAADAHGNSISYAGAVVWCD